MVLVGHLILAVGHQGCWGEDPVEEKGLKFLKNKHKQLDIMLQQTLEESIIWGIHSHVIQNLIPEDFFLKYEAPYALMG